MLRGRSVARDPRGVTAMGAHRPPTDPREPSGLETDLVPALHAAADEVPRVAARIGPRCAREEARLRTQAYLRGLLSPRERKNGWQLAEAVRDQMPYATQHLLGRADWDAEAVRDDLQADVVEHLGDPAAIPRRSWGGARRGGGRRGGTRRAGASRTGGGGGAGG